MGSYNYYHEVETTCKNCKRTYRTIHPAFNVFCSGKCEGRYRQRVENGMVTQLENYHSFMPFHVQNDDSRIVTMRERIKHLESQLKLNGIKPKGTPSDYSYSDYDEIEYTVEPSILPMDDFAKFRGR